MFRSSPKTAVPRYGNGTSNRLDGIGFIARDLTIENTAGAENDQAVALLSNSDNSVVYRCGIRAYQDTLYAKSNRQFYRECKISGTVDFIFGEATAVFQHCDIVARLPLHGQQNTITAQSRATATSTTGFSFQDCNIYADDDLRRAPAGSVETYLGRPWQPIKNTMPFSRVVFMECNISDVIDPKGWLPWEGRTDVSDIYYGEYENTGDGADVSGRVNWPSFHVIRDASEAAKFTVMNFIQGDKWIPKGTYSITNASHGNVILPSSPAKPNSSRDMVRSSPKTGVPRYGNGTSNRAPSVVYTAQWPLPARDDDAVLQQSSLPAADAVVAADGSGNYTTIAAVVAAVPLKSTKRYAIYIKKGTYNEIIAIGKNTWNLTLIGDGMEATIITGHQSVRGGVSSTCKTGTVTVDGIGFVARELTIENTAGAENDQAVALLSNSDASALYRCGIRAYQDTLYAKSNRQFYRDCKISGTVDFIFGDATAVFQHCDIIARLPLHGQQNITAQSRATATSTTVFSFQDCNIYADDDLRRAPAGSVETYLGRPWQPIQNTQPFSRVVFMECIMSNVIDPKGWRPWEGRTDIYYGEYKNTGDGADVSGRVKWTFPCHPRRIGGSQVHGGEVHPGGQVDSSNRGHMTYSITDASHGNVILPSSPAKPNSS
uniref:Pectinesterase n=1 Tax=Oryza punctata TaxID=4537 RepID=A0A0E0M449_ORYPU